MTRHKKEVFFEMDTGEDGNVFAGIYHCIRFLIILGVIVWHGLNGPALLTIVLVFCFAYLEYKHYKRMPPR